MIKIGIDPAFRVDGFGLAIYDTKEKTMGFRNFENFVVFLGWLNSEESPEAATCIIENSNLQNCTFDKKGSRDVISRKSRNVGANQAVSELTVIACKMKYGEKAVIQISPKNKGIKWNEPTFQAVLKLMAITSEKKSHNQDDRDAAKLAVRRF